jgi:hypothetical protein
MEKFQWIINRLLYELIEKNTENIFFSFLFCMLYRSQINAQLNRKKNKPSNFIYRIPKSIISSDKIVCRARVKSAFISFNEPGRRYSS